MMFQDAFKKCNAKQTQVILDEVNSLFDDMSFDPADTTIMALNIPFYSGFKLLDITDHTVMPARQRYVVYGPRKSVVLDFTNEVIYNLNKDAPITLSEDTIEDYVRFFFNYVRGKHGRFVIVENLDDIKWKESPPPAARKALGSMIQPVTLLDAYDDGGYHLEASMIFKDSLFKTNIDVTADGHVNLTNEELLIEDMPVIDDMFGQ